MKWDWNWVKTLLQSDVVLSNLVSTLALLVSLLIARMLVLRTVRRWEVPSPEIKRRWLIQVRSFSVFLLTMGMVVIWAEEIRTFALSLAAITVALVVGSKELILCFLGGILKTGARTFHVGDRIELQGFRGDVIDHNLLTTTLFEVGPKHTVHQYTGRTIILPNSLFLSNPMYNESFNRHYVMHTFVLPFKRTDDWRLAEVLLLEAAFSQCGYYLDEAKGYMSHLERTQGLDAPVMDPRVTIHFPDPDRIDLVVRVPVPAQRKGKIEQAILRKFVERWDQERVKAPLTHSPA